MSCQNVFARNALRGLLSRYNIPAVGVENTNYCKKGGIRRTDYFSALFEKNIQSSNTYVCVSYSIGTELENCICPIE